MGDSGKCPYMYHGGLSGIPWAQGFFKVEIQRHGGTCNWNSESKGEFKKFHKKTVRAFR